MLFCSSTCWLELSACWLFVMIPWSENKDCNYVKILSNFYCMFLLWQVCRARLHSGVGLLRDYTQSQYPQCSQVSNSSLTCATVITQSILNFQTCILGGWRVVSSSFTGQGGCLFYSVLSDGIRQEASLVRPVLCCFTAFSKFWGSGGLLFCTWP